MEAQESLENFVTICKSEHRNIEDLTRCGATPLQESQISNFFPTSYRRAQTQGARSSWRLNFESDA
jgi:hypothetical protein